MVDDDMQSLDDGYHNNNNKHDESFRPVSILDKGGLDINEDDFNIYDHHHIND